MALLIPIAVFQGGCPDGGANNNERGFGTDPGGVRLGIGDIAVSAQGDYIVFNAEGTLAVGWNDTGEVELLPLTEPTRLAFAHESDVVYVGSLEDGRVHAIDLIHKKRLWSVEINTVSVTALSLVVSPDDRRLLITSVDEVTVMDTTTRRPIHESTLERRVHDAVILPDGERAMIVGRHQWLPSEDEPTTPIRIIDLDDGESRDFTVPNCSDRVALTPDSQHALLAPTTCNQDPVSIIDLSPGEEHFVRHLPGFGPVAMASDGVRAVAFLDMHLIDESLFDSPDQIPSTHPDAPRYHLMVINTKTFAYTFHEVGDELPRYTISPDGQVLLVDSTRWNAETAQYARLFSLDDGQFKNISGPQVMLNNFVLTTNSDYAYALYDGIFEVDEEIDEPGQPVVDIRNRLFEIDIKAAEVRVIETSFTPTNINLSPTNKLLYLRRNEQNICVFSLGTETCTANFQIEIDVEFPESEELL
ncbi:MAG: WD40 repeat domain-containing protein [Bradymonadaceae bacterium]